MLSRAPRLVAQSPAALDMDHTILARQALQDDPELAPLQLGVRVHNGVARLFGPVPSPALARRAVACLQALPALTGVRSELFPDPWGDDPSAAGGAAELRLPGRPASRSDEARWAPSTPTVRSASRPREEAPVQTVPSVGVPLPAPTSAGAGSAPANQTRDIAQAVRRLQEGQERFRRVRIEVQGSRIILSGTVAAWRDVFELSQALTQIPGVGGVTLREIRTDPPPR
jgi:osmotically-inducible protein OsmY